MVPLRLVISEASGEDAGGFGVGGPFLHAFGIAEGRGVQWE